MNFFLVGLIFCFVFFIIVVIIMNVGDKIIDKKHGIHQHNRKKKVDWVDEVHREQEIDFRTGKRNDGQK